MPVRLRLGIAVAASLLALPTVEHSGVKLDPVAFGPQLLRAARDRERARVRRRRGLRGRRDGGSIVDLSIGFSLAQVINPTLNTQSTALAQVYSLVATMTFLATGAAEMMIAGIVRSFTAIPIDQSPQIGALTALVEHQMAQVVPIALQIAAPVLGTLLLVDVGFAFLARLVPSLNPFAAQFSVKILAGLFAVSVSLPLTIAIIGDRLSDALATSGFGP